MSSYGLETLASAECDALLQAQRVGRVGVCSARPGVFPALYALGRERDKKVRER